MAVLSGWSYRKLITITGQVGAGTDYQVQLAVGESSGSASPDFHVENNSEDFPSATNDSGDLRFTTDDGTTLLPFYVASVTGTTPNRVANIWVKVSASLETDQNIYCYYGNDVAINVSDPYTTFIIYNSGDTISGMTSVSSGITWSTSAGEIIASATGNNKTGSLFFDVTTGLNSYRMFASMRFSGNPGANPTQEMGFRFDTSQSGTAGYARHCLTTNLAGKWQLTGPGGTDESGAEAYTNGAYHSYIFIKDDDAWELFVDGVSKITRTEASFNAQYVGLWSAIRFTGYAERFINIIVTKYNTTEPTFDSAGTEEVNAIYYDINQKFNSAFQIISDLNNKFSFSDQVISNINNKFNSVKRVLSDLKNNFFFVQGAIYDCINEFRSKVQNFSDISNDIRFIYSWQVPGDAGVQSLGKSYIKVYFGGTRFTGVEQTDVDIDSIEIHKVLNESHTASLDLGRAYDATTPALETLVTIYYNTWLLYKGYIAEVNTTDSPEKINLLCQDNYWKVNRGISYFMVGHNPLTNHAPYYVETYYDTPKIALSTAFSITTDIGNFIPQTMNCFGMNSAEAITSLITNSGNFAWYYDVDDTFKLWRAGSGNIISLDRQVLGTNIGLYQVIDHQFKLDATNVVNRFRVQMGPKVYSSSLRNYMSYQYVFETVSATPAWDVDNEVRAKDSVDGYGYDYHKDLNPSDTGYKNYADVYKKYALPPHTSSYDEYADVFPPKVILYSTSPDFCAPVEITEGFTIDYANNTLTLDDPHTAKEYDVDGNIVQEYSVSVRVKLAKKRNIGFTDTGNSLVFYTPKMGSYATTITKELQLSDLNISAGGSRINTGTPDFNWIELGPWDDTAFALDYAKWLLSKTQEQHITGNIDITLDALCFYGIDLLKRISISGITTSSMNITSIDLNLRNFTASVSLENSQAYTRTVSVPWHGE